jgi:hypothetical protein
MEVELMEERKREEESRRSGGGRGRYKYGGYGGHGT